jgi:hypothetical protein
LITICQPIGRSDSSPVDKSAIGAAQILDEIVLALPDQPGMSPRDLWVRDGDIAGHVPTNRHQLFVQHKNPVWLGAFAHDQTDFVAI